MNAALDAERGTLGPDSRLSCSSTPLSLMQTPTSMTFSPNQMTRPQDKRQVYDQARIAKRTIETV